jgi:Na+-driven multidrug efflux pump
MINVSGCRRQERGCVGLASAGAGARKGGEKRGQSGETLGARAARTLPRPWSDELDRRIIRVLLPCSLSFLVVPLTNAVDAAWIGRMGDALALAGQGAANQVFSTAFFLISFLPTVMAPLVARAVGKSDEDDARARIGETLFLATFFGVLGSIALAVYPGVCMRIVLPDDAAALAHANSYLWVRSLSLLPALWGSVGFAALRGAGHHDATQNLGS